MTYTIAKQFNFSSDEYGTVSMQDGNGEKVQTIHIPKDCIQHVIDVLEQYK